MKEVAAALWSRAAKALASANILLHVDADGAASRAYYAAFYATSAFFMLEGRSFRSHRALETAVHRDLVREGRWTEQLGADYSFLQRMRNTGDYGEVAHVVAQDAEQAVVAAGRILEAVKRGSPESFAESDEEIGRG